MTIRSTYHPEILASVASLKAGKVHHRKIVLSIRDKTRKLPAGTPARVHLDHPARREGSRDALTALGAQRLLAAVASPAISWALGAGTPGIFTVRFLDCHKGCAWIGDFTSSDREMAAQDVQLVTLDGFPKLKPGDSVHAIDVRSIYGNSAYAGRPSIRNILSLPLWPFEVMVLLLLFFFLRWTWTVPVRCFRWRPSGGEARLPKGK